MRPDPVRTTLTGAVVLLAVAASTSGCGSAPPKSPPTGVDELTIPTESPDPADFVARIDNQWLPLTPGTVWTYQVTGEDGDQTEVVTVLDRAKVVAGVTTTVVHDVVKGADGQVVEDTYDWFAQDTRGNVWYFGEETTAYDEGEASTEGSWEAGVDGAMAGVVMLADPRVGDGYRQEYLPGTAEDQASVLDTAADVSVPYGDFSGALLTEDTTPLEPDLVEHKTYVEGIGLVREEDIRGGSDLGVLVEWVAP